MKDTASVLLFGITRDITGQSAVSVPLPEGACVADLLSQLYRQYPDLSGIRSILVAVNGEYAESDQVVHSKDEIALIPPVSGG
ncbi:MoaD/ThiS family protein [Spirosoma montaniterrae]|uniref:Molybdopterin synthase sulfur carrier subunit n=1 Tax=Spirosoma montaniterrae TaxID=1178516 RepID=A0A1P9WY55_9BACT|nr:MoaD/ThiS family protein [Spirosoma montaniterrae]AQG80316.1 molybdopterin synthase sulfur carrier subunit [Spirosoma montaniterrae]